jgi:hypothetical protein
VQKAIGERIDAQAGPMVAFRPSKSVSETVSKSGGRVGKNSFGLKQIVLETPMKSAILCVLYR